MGDPNTSNHHWDSVTMTTDTGASTEVLTYGAHLCSWKTVSGKEWIFLSKDAVFEDGKAIRGGVPIIFPQFNEFGPGGRHGFARNSVWELTQEPASTPQGLECVFTLKSDERTLVLWPHAFEARFRVLLSGDSLEMSLEVDNTSDAAFQFTVALHSYFLVNDIHQVSLLGLKTCDFWDNDGRDFASRTRADDELNVISVPLDRVYFDSANELSLCDGEHKLAITHCGFPDVVVWNPGEAGAAAFADMANTEYKNMLCVEGAAVDKLIVVEPGGRWIGKQSLRELS
ncbi:MAG: glucose-6-phosphate 1-epimerase [Flavobacteriales bacterium]|jgi:glucose-6-phosphate 1-epimerase